MRLITCWLYSVMTFSFCNVKITELVSQSRMKLRVFVGVLLDFSSRITKSYIAVVYRCLLILFCSAVNLIQIVYVWGGRLSFNTKFFHLHFTDLESSSRIAELWSAIDALAHSVAELWSAVGSTSTHLCCDSVSLSLFCNAQKGIGRGVILEKCTINVAKNEVKL